MCDCSNFTGGDGFGPAPAFWTPGFASAPIDTWAQTSVNERDTNFSNITGGQWVTVAQEGEVYNNPITQQLRYGTGDKWIYKTINGPITVLNQKIPALVRASNDVFGYDPAPNYLKVLQVYVTSEAPVDAPPPPSAPQPEISVPNNPALGDVASSMANAGRPGTIAAGTIANAGRTGSVTAGLPGVAGKSNLPLYLGLGGGALLLVVVALVIARR